MDSNIIKYLNIDSTYRDRNRYKNPGNFDILTGNVRNKFDAYDPISFETPIITFTPSSNIVSLQGPGVLTRIIPGMPDAINSPTNIYVITLASNNVNKTLNYYRGIGVRLAILPPLLLGPPAAPTIGPDGQIIQPAMPVVELEETIVAGWIYVGTFNNLDCFNVRLRSPISIDLEAPTFELSLEPQVNFEKGYLHIPLGPNTYQEYKDYFIYNDTLQESVPIISYDGELSLATFNPTIWPINSQISIRKKLASFSGLFQGGSTTTEVILDATSSNITNFYKGSFIRIVGANLNNNEIRRVINYENFTATVSPAFPIAPLLGDFYEILEYSKDNYSPLQYSNEYNRQIIYYDVQLLSLTLPNIILDSGDDIGSYPYLYVELRNIESLTSPNILYSNNPNAVKKLFRVPVLDISPPVLNSFITLNSGFAVETIRLNPNGYIRFGVYLPDGSPFMPNLNDTMSPQEPNRYLQVSATFSLKKV